MSRILRNYLISFVIIGLLLLIVHLINRYVEGRTDRTPAPGPRQEAPRSAPASGRMAVPVPPRA